MSMENQSLNRLGCSNWVALLRTHLLAVDGWHAAYPQALGLCSRIVRTGWWGATATTGEQSCPSASIL